MSLTFLRVDLTQPHSTVAKTIHEASTAIITQLYGTDIPIASLFFGSIMWHEGALAHGGAGARYQIGGGPGRGLMQFEPERFLDTTTAAINDGVSIEELFSTTLAKTAQEVDRVFRLFKPTGYTWPVSPDDQIERWLASASEGSDSFGVLAMILDAKRSEIAFPASIDPVAFASLWGTWWNRGANPPTDQFASNAQDFLTFIAPAVSTNKSMTPPLAKSTASSGASMSTTDAVALFCAAHPVVLAGATGSAVEHARELLGLTGSLFDDQFAQIVCGVQTDRGLNPDGKIGPATWAILHPVLKLGMPASKYVGELQAALGISVDTIFGPNTLTAVVAFQSASGIIPDGEVGIKTYAKLLNAELPPSILPPELSGVQWVTRFPPSVSLSTLVEPFQTMARKFLAALDDAKITYNITQTRRPAERAWLMAICADIVNGLRLPETAPLRADIPIIWDHGDHKASISAAQDMFDAYGISGTASLTSNHIAGLAIDLDNIVWTGKPQVKTADGSMLTIMGVPDPNNDDPTLLTVGDGYGVHRGVNIRGDRVHWSIDGT